ncbi:alkylation response protein AidB-like acyl-CoA dehydrogenase [Blastococcus colisei]|uniref:Alkylation response protein AidB-like acyl-CoA dehydrogenase n=1 Tax=Blastococcus colisei TaxID=1564162 RepID=A0A543PA70_9ACTN|nr:acyl-CoA dehydrogenase family protein [Blastococcus colisei]TQN40983.1 alkylation response protein AidB-like acyl-CoA dehydrogenase [Blastococcus colisei]
MGGQPIGLGRASLISNTSDEHRNLRESVAKLVAGYGRAYFQDVVAKGQKADALWADMGAAGFLGVHLPEEHGGGGGGLADLAVVIEEMAAQGCPMFMIVISPAICGSVLAAHGTPEQKQRYLPGIADGTFRMAFAITEPDAGSNTHKITTTAHRDGDGWRLRGQKYWTSGVDECQALLVVARDADPGPDGRNTLSLFIVPTDAPGLSFQQLDSALQLPEKQFTTFFDDVPVERIGLVGAEGEGLKQVFAGLNPERVAAACMANGIARYALARGAQYARERIVWKAPIGAHQGVAHPLAKAYIDVELARLMTMRAATMTDQGLDAAEAGNIAKFAAGDACVQALDQAIQVHGGNGLSNEFGLADLWFIGRMFKTAPVSREMVLNHIAQHSLGLPKSY